MIVSSRRVALAFYGSVDPTLSWTTLGDAMAVYNVGRSLQQAGIDFDIAWTGPLHDLSSKTVALDDIEPADYATFVWVCGPLHPDLRETVGRFQSIRRVGVGVSLVEGIDAEGWFDDLLVRDSLDKTSFDLAIADIGWPHLACTPAERVDTAAVCFVGAQTEYGDRAHFAEVERLAMTALEEAGVGNPVHVDTRLSPIPALRFAAEAAIQRATCLVTTRLHGALLALYHLVPVLAIDQVSAGAKVSRVIGRTEWPLLLNVDQLDARTLRQAIERLRDGSLRGELRTAREKMIVLSRTALDQATALIRRWP